MKHADKYSNICKSSLLLGLLLLSLPCSHAFADDTKNKQERAAQRRMQQMQQKFEQDKAALEQENASLKEQMKTSEGKLAAAQKALARYQQETKKAQAENSEKETQLNACRHDAESAQLAARNELAEFRKNLQQSEALNKQLNGEKSRLEAVLAQQKAEVNSCQVKNGNLIGMFKEMSAKYEKADLKYIEPFTGLQGVGIENSFQDSRDKAEAQLYTPRK
ncbi:MAG: hypothetical protein K2Q14_05245 [Gammaproteobacteria bacterium]|nr:hypothetical protein [Gammaproteobacteria bacterium]